MMLVMFGMILVMSTSVIFFSQRQLRATVDQEQTERSFQVAEAGIQYTLFLLNSGVYNTEQILTAGPIEKEMDDEILGEDSGTFTLSFSPVEGAPAGKAVNVTSEGRDSAGISCQHVEARIERFNAEITYYGITKWDHLPECD